MILNMLSFVIFEDMGLMAKIKKSLKFKPHFKIVEDMKAEAEDIRKKAFEEGELKGIKEGVSQGKIIGMAKEKVSMAKSMLKDGTDINFIMKHTELTADDIDDLKNEMKNPD